MPEEIQDAILKEKISERHARALLTVQDTKIQKELVDKVINEKMSVRALEEEIETRYPKGKSASEIPIDSNASAGEFLDLTPLSPTEGAIQEEVSNYGKVVIAPPKEETEEEEKEGEGISTDRFVNYGEIGKDNDPNTGMDGQEIPFTSRHIDMDEVRKNSVDIKPSSSGAALDNLLNINTGSAAPLSKEEIKQKEDYFSLPEVPDMKLNDAPDDDNDGGSSNSILPFSNTQPLIPNISNVSDRSEPSDNSIIIPTSNINYTFETASKKIVELVDELKEHGVSIHLDEMNFPTSYQVIIKIDKE